MISCASFLLDQILIRSRTTFLNCSTLFKRLLSTRQIVASSRRFTSAVEERLRLLNLMKPSRPREILRTGSARWKLKCRDQFAQSVLACQQML